MKIMSALENAIYLLIEDINKRIDALTNKLNEDEIKKFITSLPEIRCPRYTLIRDFLLQLFAE